MIDQGTSETPKRIKALGTESVHGLPLEWPEPKRTLPNQKQTRRSALATQNVHGLPTSWNELDLSE